jgi:hypothetical protein
MSPFAVVDGVDDRHEMFVVIVGTVLPLAIFAALHGHIRICSGRDLGDSDAVQTGGVSGRVPAHSDVLAFAILERPAGFQASLQICMRLFQTNFMELPMSAVPGNKYQR